MTACWATALPLRQRPNRCSTLTQRETTRPHVTPHHTCRQQSARRPPRYKAPKHRLGRAQTHEKPLKTSWPTRSVVPVPSPAGSAKWPTTPLGCRTTYRPPSRAYKLRNTQFGARTSAIFCLQLTLLVSVAQHSIAGSQNKHQKCSANAPLRLLSFRRTTPANVTETSRQHKPPRASGRKSEHEQTL